MISEGLQTYLLGLPALAALVADRVYVNVIPQGASKPLVLVTRLDEDPHLTLEDSGGMRTAEFDIDAYASTPGKAGQVIGVIRGEIDDYKGAMGDETCDGVWIQDESDSIVPPQHGSGASSHVTTLNLRIDYQP